MTTNSKMNGRIQIKVGLVGLLMCGLKWRAMMMRKRLLVLGGSSWSETDNLRLSSGLTLLAHPVLQPGIMFNFFSIVLLTQFFYGTYTGTHFWYIIFPVPVPVLFSVRKKFQIPPQKTENSWEFSDTVVNCPIRWSLYCPLGICIDHLVGSGKPI